MRSNFEEKKQTRIERYSELAAKNETNSSALFARSRDMLSCIPFGQPILVGHHSEKGHRSLLKRSDNTMRKAVETSDKAEYYAEKAHAAENNNTIFSDDPEAIPKLKTKIEELDEQRTFMKSVNSAYRTFAKKGDDSKLKALKLTDKSIKKLDTEIKAASYDKQPYPRYIFSNLSQNINRLKKRLAKLEKEATEETTEKEIDGLIRIVDNVEDNRLQLFFPDKPNEEIRTQLRKNAFRWSPSVGAWQRHRSNAARYAAKNIIDSLNV
jgi:Domain of unknown function (DUF3560)